MKAIVIREYGPPEVLRYEDVADPVPRQGEIRIKVHAATVNRVLDVSLRAGREQYRGPVLPQSEAPGVVEIRNELHTLLRSSLLASRNPDAVLAFADTTHGRDDYEIWSHAVEVLPRISPRRTTAEAHLEYLDQLLG